MDDLGRALIWAGVVWVFAKLVFEIIQTLRGKPGLDDKPKPPIEVQSQPPVAIDPSALAKLAAVPYGPGLTLALLGVVLLIVANGFSVNVGASTAPTPAPSASPQ
ncbi:MAG: hypothetical protein M3198_18450 [Actinomycetota bacterium]|nr:hypothetical protein [Actinomycetota bacterium]